VHSKQAQAPLHSDLLATSSRRNPRPYVIDLHRAEAQVRFGPHLPRGHFKHCAVREDYFARQSGRHTASVCDDSGFAVNKAGVHLPFLMQARADMATLSCPGTDLNWLVREQCAVCNKCSQLPWRRTLPFRYQINVVKQPTKEAMSKRPSHIFATTCNTRISPGRDVGAHGCQVLFCTYTHVRWK
jgi:hypothetical protein